MTEFPFTYLAKRRLFCFWFHWKHIRKTHPQYAEATGHKWYCNKCYELKTVNL